MAGAALAAPFLPAVALAEVELLIEFRPGFSPLSLGLAEGDGVRLRRFSPGELSDPIASGRIQSRLMLAEGVVAVGLEAGLWAARELEGVHIHFSGGVSRVSGAALKARGWTGELAVGASAFLDFATTQRWKRIGVLYTPGFEGVLPAIRAAGSARGLAVEAREVAVRQDIPAAAQSMARESDAIWLLGDPVLTTGPGFDYLIGLSLSRRIPLLVPETDLIKAGGYAAWEPDWEIVASSAAALGKRVRGGLGWPQARVALGGEAGRLVINEVLRRRWADVPTGGIR